jgi:hypothetical protein
MSGKVTGASKMFIELTRQTIAKKRRINYDRIEAEIRERIRLTEKNIVELLKFQREVRAARGNGDVGLAPGIFESMTTEEIRHQADGIANDETIKPAYRMLLGMCFHIAAEYKLSALAFRKYLMDGNVTEAMLARRFVSDPKVEVRDDGPGRGWVVLIKEDHGKANVIRGGEPFDEKAALWIAEQIREYGAHVLEHARRNNQ